KVKVKTWVEKYSRLRSVYKYEIFNEKGELATTGSTELNCIKEDTFKPIRLDRYFPDWHEANSKVQTLNNEGKTVEIMDGIDSL
ncbi:acyl-CoA thioesterase, partial [Staphylococcus aureus]|uniref:acyl-CoA thioesterase n=1 Tax=Staphylococcus aureus TaxID=1280 RepID=UPI000A642BE9